MTLDICRHKNEYWAFAFVVCLWLMDNDRYCFTTRKAQLHDVGKFSTWIVNRNMIGDHQCLQRMTNAAKLNETTGTTLSLWGKHFHTLGLRGPCLGEDGLNICGFKAGRCVEKVKNFRRRLDSILWGHFGVNKTVVLIPHEIHKGWWGVVQLVWLLNVC